MELTLDFIVKRIVEQERYIKEIEHQFFNMRMGAIRYSELKKSALAVLMYFNDKKNKIDKEAGVNVPEDKETRRILQGVYDMRKTHWLESVDYNDNAHTGRTEIKLLLQPIPKHLQRGKETIEIINGAKAIQTPLKWLSPGMEIKYNFFE